MFVDVSLPLRVTVRYTGYDRTGWNDYRHIRMHGQQNVKIDRHVSAGQSSMGFETFVNLLAPELFFLILAHPVYKR